jgi:hypothetical protein
MKEQRLDERVIIWDKQSGKDFNRVQSIIKTRHLKSNVIIFSHVSFWP